MSNPLPISLHYNKRTETVVSDSTYSAVEAQDCETWLCSGEPGPDMRTRRTRLLVQWPEDRPPRPPSWWSDTMCTSHGQTKETPSLSSANISQRLCHCISYLSTHKGVIAHRPAYQALAVRWCHLTLKLKCKHGEEKHTRRAHARL